MKSVCVLTILIIASVAVSAADSLNGKWKGEIAAGPCGGFGAPGGGGGLPSGGGGRGGPGLNLLGAGQRGGGFPGGPGGRFPGGPDGGGFSGRSGGVQKIALNIKAKEDKKTSQVKLTGNITIGDSTEDIRDGKVGGSRISFSTGKKPPVCQYAGEFNAETNDLRMTRTIAGSTAQGIQFTLKR